MATYHELDVILDRISFLNWDYNSRQYSGGLASVYRLSEEYMRRQYFWAQAFNTRWHWLSGLPFCVEPDIKLSDDFHTCLSGVPFPNVFMRLTCQLMLLWEMVKDSPSLQEINLPHPYHPLLMLYERGGVLLPEGKIVNAPFVTVGAINGTKPLLLQPHLYDIETPFVSLDEDELNQIDMEMR